MIITRRQLRRIIAEELNRLNEGASIPADIAKKMKTQVRGKMERTENAPTGRLSMDVTVKDGVAESWAAASTSKDEVTKAYGSYTWRKLKKEMDAVDPKLKDGVYTLSVVV